MRFVPSFFTFGLSYCVAAYNRWSSVQPDSANLLNKCHSLLALLGGSSLWISNIKCIFPSNCESIFESDFFSQTFDERSVAFSACRRRTSSTPRFGANSRVTKSARDPAGAGPVMTSARFAHSRISMKLGRSRATSSPDESSICSSRHGHRIHAFPSVLPLMIMACPLLT